MINYEELWNTLIKVMEKTDEDSPLYDPLMTLIDVTRAEYQRNLFETVERLANTDEK